MGDYSITKNYSAIEAKETFKRMLNKPKFLEYIPYVIQNKLGAETSYDDIYNQAKALKILLKAELDKLIHD